MVGISDHVEGQVPAAAGGIGQLLGLTGDGEDLAPGSSYLIDDARPDVLPQLAATGWSPEPAREDEYHEGVLVELAFEPASSGPPGRVEGGRQAMVGRWP